MRYQPRVVRSPAAHAPGVRSGRSCHMQPTRPWESPVRPAVGFDRSSHTRLQQPASRSASGRVLSPPYAAARPNARSTGARGQRASRPASGAHPTRGRPDCCRHALVRARPVHQPARAAKAHCGGNSAATTRHRHPPPSRSTSSRRPAAPARSRPRAATAPLATPELASSTESACGLLAAHPMPHATPDAAAPEDRLPPTEDAAPAVTIAPAIVHRKRGEPHGHAHHHRRPCGHPVIPRAGVGARGLRPHTAHRARDRRQLRRRLPAVLQPLLPCAQERGVAVRATTRS